MRLSGLLIASGYLNGIKNPIILRSPGSKSDPAALEFKTQMEGLRSQAIIPHSGHSWHTFQDLEGRRNGYEQLSQAYTAVAFGAGRRSHGPCLCLTPARERKMEVDCPREQCQRCQATLCSLHPWEETQRKAPPPTPTLKAGGLTKN